MKKLQNKNAIKEEAYNKLWPVKPHKNGLPPFKLILSAINKLAKFTVRYLLKRGTTWNDLKRARNDLTDLQRARNDLKWPTTSKKRPEMAYNEQETTWNDPQRVRHNLQWSEHNYTELGKDAKRPTTSIFSDYFTIWGKRFSSLTRFPLDIWLQSFEHFFTKNDGENRASSIYYHASSVNYHVYLLWDIRFIFFCLGFMSAEKVWGYYVSSSLPLPPASRVVRSSAFAFIREV